MTAYAQPARATSLAGPRLSDGPGGGLVPCSAPPRERTRYFARMLVTPDDLTRDQQYHIESRQYWTRLLHGWGIARGLGVTRAAAPPNQPSQGIYLAVGWGDALDYHGRALTLRVPAVVDLTREDAEGNLLVVEGEATRPEEASASAVRAPGGTYLLAVRYAELRSRFVRSPLGPMADGSEACEASALRDSYAFRLLPDGPTAVEDARQRGWVVLATIEFQGTAGLQLTTTHRHDFPVDPFDSTVDPQGEPSDMVFELAAGHFERAEKQLDLWQSALGRAFEGLLLPEGRDILRRMLPTDSLDGLPAKFLGFSPNDPESSRRLKHFFERAESPYHPARELTVRCLTRLPRAELIERVRFVFGADEISDEAICHAHRAARLLPAVVRQWPLPTFEGLP